MEDTEITEELQETLRAQLMETEHRVEAACRRAGRKREDVTLIAVSKTKPVPMLETIYDAGVRDFGENKVQELKDKHDVCAEDIRWHMIGHLQKNKVKYLIGRACMIHSVDSFDLAEEISKRAAAAGIVMPVLIEVNVAGEESKFGVKPTETEALVREIAPLPGLRVKGLMTVAPYTDDPEDSRPVFRALRELLIDIDRKNIDNVEASMLSMGMTGDYETAIEEGATFVRVGTGIFGARVYPAKS